MIRERISDEMNWRKMAQALRRILGRGPLTLQQAEAAYGDASGEALTLDRFEQLLAAWMNREEDLRQLTPYVAAGILGEGLRAVADDSWWNPSVAVEASEVLEVNLGSWLIYPVSDIGTRLHSLGIDTHRLPPAPSLRDAASIPLAYDVGCDWPGRERGSGGAVRDAWSRLDAWSDCSGLDWVATRWQSSLGSAETEEEGWFVLHPGS